MEHDEVAKQLLAIASQLEALASQLAESIDTEAAFPVSMWAKVDQGICLICDEPILPIEKSMRGAHNRCYKQMRDKINETKTTDEKQVKLGRLLPGKKGGRKPSKTALKVESLIREDAAQYEETKAAPKKSAKKSPPG